MGGGLLCKDAYESRKHTLKHTGLPRSKASLRLLTSIWDPGTLNIPSWWRPDETDKLLEFLSDLNDLRTFRFNAYGNCVSDVCYNRLLLWPLSGTQAGNFQMPLSGLKCYFSFICLKEIAYKWDHSPVIVKYVFALELQTCSCCFRAPSILNTHRLGWWSKCSFAQQLGSVVLMPERKYISGYSSQTANRTSHCQKKKKGDSRLNIPAQRIAKRGQEEMVLSCWKVPGWMRACLL